MSKQQENTSGPKICKIWKKERPIVKAVYFSEVCCKALENLSVECFVDDAG